MYSVCSVVKKFSMVSLPVGFSVTMHIHPLVVHESEKDVRFEGSRRPSGHLLYAYGSQTF